MLKKLSLLLRQIFFCQRGVSTLDSLVVTGVADIDAVIPEFWADGVFSDANRDSFWGALTGKEGTMMPIIDKTGPLRQKGDQLSFSVISQLMGTGVTGENALIGNEESLSVGTFTVSADYVRHAVGVTKKADRQSNFSQVSSAGQLLRDWMTRKMDADIFTLITGDTNEVIYANSKTTEASLNADDGDVFGPTELDLIRLALLRKGALPIVAKLNNGRKVPVYGCVFSEVEEYRLNQNTTFVQSIQNALKRFDGNGDHPLFKGAIGVFKNMVLYTYYSLLPIPQGTPLRPETTVFATLTTTATTLSVGGATATTATQPDYTLYFASSGSLQISDEILSYSGKSKNSFTGLSRGVSSTTAVQHVPDALVTQRNVATVIGFGAQSVCRALGDKPGPIGEKKDYGMGIGLGIEAYYGQALRKDSRLNRAAGIINMKVYSSNPSTI